MSDLFSLLGNGSPDWNQQPFQLIKTGDSLGGVIAGNGLPVKLPLWSYNSSSATTIAVSGGTQEQILWNDADPTHSKGSLIIPPNVLGLNGPYSRIIFEGNIYSGGTMSFTGGQLRLYINNVAVGGVWPITSDLVWSPIAGNGFYMTKVRWELNYIKVGVTNEETQVITWPMFNVGYAGTYTGNPASIPATPGMVENDVLPVNLPWGIPNKAEFRIRVGACTVAGTMGCRTAEMWAE